MRKIIPSAVQRLQKGSEAGLRLGIVRGQRHQHADAPHPLGLLPLAASGHAAAAPPSMAMNARRLIRSPRRRAPAGTAAG